MLQRHIGILVDIGRLAGENAELARFLDPIVIQIARAVEIRIRSCNTALAAPISSSSRVSGGTKALLVVRRFPQT